MKIVIGIVLVAIVIAALILYLLLIMNSHDLAFCGDIQQSDGNNLSVQRIYTADFNANETLSEIVNRMNSNESGNMSAEELAEIMATYQNVIYAPVFLFNLTKEDENTFVLTGNVYNGINEAGEPTSPDFTYKNLTLTAGVADGKMLAVQNVYNDNDEEGQPSFRERRKVVDPVLMEDDQTAAFAFRDCDGFRIVFTKIPEADASITLAFEYEVVAQNPLDFTNLPNGTLGVTITEDYDDRGELVPELKIERIFAIPSGE